MVKAQVANNNNNKVTSSSGGQKVPNEATGVVSRNCPISQAKMEAYAAESKRRQKQKEKRNKDNALLSVLKLLYIFAIYMVGINSSSIVVGTAWRRATIAT